MKTLRNRMLPCALTAALAFCAGKPEITFAWDRAASFANLKTYAWYADPKFQMPHGGSIVDGRFVDERVREAVERDLAKKGYTKGREGSADLYVSYATSAEGVASQDKFGSYDWWTMTIYVGGKYQKKGSLTLDIRDRGQKLIWRGAKAAILGTNPEKVGRDIDDAVSDLLAKFPPPPGSEAK
jgi:hypothetical protein